MFLSVLVYPNAHPSDEENRFHLFIAYFLKSIFIVCTIKEIHISRVLVFVLLKKEQRRKRWKMQENDRKLKEIVVIVLILLHEKKREKKENDSVCNGKS